MNKHTEKVRTGAALLDDKFPGWRELIDLRLLDVRSEFDCILGQLWGTYTRGLAEVFPNIDFSDWQSKAVPRNYGFNYPQYEWGDHELDDAWKRELLSA